MQIRAGCACDFRIRGLCPDKWFRAERAKKQEKQEAEESQQQSCIGGAVRFVTPVPAPTAIIRFCMGKASVTAVSALSLILDTKMLSTML